MKVVLTPLAITDLSISYARKMEGNRILHYRVSDILSLIDPNGQNPFAMVTNYIREQEGQDVDVSLNDTINQEKLTLEREGILQKQDVTKSVLKGERRVLKALLKRKAIGTLHQSNYWPGGKLDELKDLVSYHLNTKVILPINKFINKLKGIETPNVDYSIAKRIPYMLPAGLPYLNDERWIRIVNLIRYIGVTYKESQEKEAFVALKQDLKTMHAHGLILGHLSMPSTIELADTLGSGEKLKVVFAFVITNDQIGRALLGRNPLDLPNMYLSLLGIKYEMTEGALPPYLNGIDPKSEYQVEVIDITPGYHDANRKAYIDSYLSSRDYINEIAKDAKKQLNEMEKIESATLTSGDLIGVGRPILDFDKEGKILDTGKLSEGQFKAKEVHVNVKYDKKKPS